MTFKHKDLFLWGILRSTIIGTLLLALFTGLVCWFGEWRTWWAYGNGLIYAGVALLFIDGLLFIGGQSQSSPYQGSKHGFNPMPVDDRKVSHLENSKQHKANISDAIRTAATLVFPAILSIIIGLILVRMVD